MFPLQQQQQRVPPRAAASKMPLIIVGGLVIVGAIVAVVVVTGGSKKAGGDSIDLENQELAAVRDQVCACKDEACQRAAMAQLDDITKRATDSGVTASKDQHALGKKTFDEIGACLKGSTGAPATTSGGSIVAEMAALRDAVCACKTVDCAVDLQPKFDQWRATYMPTFQSLSADVKRQTLEATRAQKKCFDDLKANAR